MPLGLKSIAHTEPIVPIIEALKELKSKNDALKETVSALAKELTEIKVGLNRAGPTGDKPAKLEVFSNLGQ